MFLKRIKLLQENIPSFQEYPFSIPSIKSFHELHLEKSVTFFVGENGSGKSTLLEAIAYQCEFNTAGGGRNNIYDVHAAESALGEYIKLSWMPKITNGFFLRAESFYNFAAHLDEVEKGNGSRFSHYGGQSLFKQSHGESFLALFLNRFKDKAIYLLDEPEAALSPSRQLTLLRILYNLASKGEAQFIIATHSPIILGYPYADILSFDDGEISKIEYEMTDHYQLTKYFLENRQKLLSELFKEDE
ncbi:AAA family ATPase [Bacillus lacus]|uniref:AAA family ATPase n=1 Tax=Metabacillus lacus TaxID=1983721 RepID=A0A7X2IYG6_9BACI|nr:AAA family ATPase [Metabacillus lacus]MRX72120.1 AAA family ATPase [Metabacillus lacus]